MSNGKLFLLGAGPGDPELITVKSVKALAAAEIVLYDALVNPQLLEHCSSSCLQVYVGKRSGYHSMSQHDINQLIVHHGLEGKVVVRLKGGDPFIFGRGHEELVYARQHGMIVEVIPGISSCIGVPGHYQIPLTKRGVNESFWVVTGNNCQDLPSSDLVLAAQSSATVVVLMGMRNLRTIVDVFKRFRDNEEPIAVISNGTLPEGTMCAGQLLDIVEKVKLNAIATPTIIVIGKVVGEALKTDQRLTAIKEQFMISG